MSDLSDVLNDKEKRTLVQLGVAAAVLAVLFAVVWVRERSASSGVRAELTSLQTESQKAKTRLAEARLEEARWREARRELDSLRGTYFYSDKNGIEALRLDLERIFEQAGMRSPTMDYRYADMGKEKVKRIVTSFPYTGTYASLKKFLSIIENTPRFLVIDEIDFTNTGSGGGPLTLKMTLAGYYESD